MKLGSRIKVIAAVVVGLALVAGGGLLWAQSTASASQRYVSAVAATGDVTQTYTATGSVSRQNTAKATFSVSGTVASVAVAVGDTVEAGDTLATLDKGKLQLAVLNATTAVAQAEASLYSAEHPASVSSGSGGSGGSTGVFVDPAMLSAATAQVNRAVQDEAAACAAIVGSVTGGGTPTAEPSASSSPTASPTATASGLSAVSAASFSDAELAACADARATLITANADLQRLIAKLTAGSGSSPNKTTTVKVSKSAVAKANAALLQAQQNLDTAEANLAKATLRAPITGSVGTVGLTAGASAASGSITIVGSGNAEVSFELPLKTRRLVEVGQAITVAPAGSSRTLTGTITAIASLATSGTSGDTASYSATALIDDPDALLPSGSKAAVRIPVASVTGVLRVPASAVTPTGSGTATVKVVTDRSASTAKTTQVKTGAMGGGWVEISSGLTAGDLVVLADNTAELPAYQSTRRRTTSTSSATSTGTPVATSGSTAEASAPAAQPSATATSR